MMEFTVSENPGLSRALIRKHHGNLKRAWAEKRRGKTSRRTRSRRSNPHRKVASVRRHARAFTRSVARPVLHRRGRRRYVRSSRSRNLTPGIVIANPRHRRRHYRRYARRNPVVSGLVSTVIDSAKTLVGFLAANGITNVTSDMISSMAKLNPVNASYAKNVVRMAIGLGGTKLASRWIGQQLARDIQLVTVTVSLFDVLMTVLKQNPTTATFVIPFDIPRSLPAPTGVTIPAATSGMGRITERSTMGRIVSTDGSIRGFNQLQEYQMQ